MNVQQTVQELVSEVSEAISPDKCSQAEAVEVLEELIGDLQMQAEAIRSEMGDEG